MNITEQQLKKIILEETQSVLFKPGLLEHVKTGTPLHENIFRIGSSCYFNTIEQGRKFYKVGLYEAVNEEERDMLENTNLGEWAMFEGEDVPLDFPMYEETLNEKISTTQDRIQTKTTDRWGEFFANYNITLSEDNKFIIPYDHPQFDEIMYQIQGHLDYGVDDEREVMIVDMSLRERKKKKKKKDPPIGKPTKNTGGGKKYKVYVKNKKTGRVKKITYGDSKGGLKGNWNSAEARKSFASRHQCAKKKDRTKAGYWACRAHKDFGTNVPGRFW